MQHPKFTSIYYRQDDRGSAQWQTIDPVNRWTRQFLPDVARYRYGSGYFPGMGTQATIAAPAPDDQLTPPALRVLTDTVHRRPAHRVACACCPRGPRPS